MNLNPKLNLDYLGRCLIYTPSPSILAIKPMPEDDREMDVALAVVSWRWCGGR